MASQEPPNVFVILVNWKGWEDTKMCLESLQDLTYPNYSIIVVDNASEDDSVNQLKALFPEVITLESAENRGFAGGNNLGIKYAMNHGADYVWLLNNDTVVHEKALSTLINRAEQDEETGMCGSTLIYYDQRDTIQALAGGTYNKWLGITKNIGQNKRADMEFDRVEVERQLEYIVGASMLVSRKCIEQVGILTEDYFLYYEEVDWAMRAQGAFKLGYAPESIIYHKEGASTGGSQLNAEAKSKISDYYQLKNRLKFTYRFFPKYLPFVYLTVVFALFNRMLRGQWNRIPMIIKLMFNFNKEPKR